jgi:hypothetical protein
MLLRFRYLAVPVMMYPNAKHKPVVNIIQRAQIVRAAAFPYLFMLSPYACRYCQVTMPLERFLPAVKPPEAAPIQ